MLDSLPPLHVVPSATHLEIELMKSPRPVVEFSSDDDESRYAKSDWLLATRIGDLAVASCGNGDAEALVFNHTDWYPTKSRTLDIDLSIFSLTLVRGLIALLDGDHADWRIHLDVYAPLSGHSADFGVACLARDRVLIQRNLYERL